MLEIIKEMNKINNHNISFISKIICGNLEI